MIRQTKSFSSYLYTLSFNYLRASASMFLSPGPLIDTYHLAGYYSTDYAAIKYSMINKLIATALRTIRAEHPDVSGIYVYAYSPDNGVHVQLDIDSPYYDTKRLGLLPSKYVETGSNRRWYYWPIA